MDQPKQRQGVAKQNKDDHGTPEQTRGIVFGIAKLTISSSELGKGSIEKIDFFYEKVLNSGPHPPTTTV